MILDYEDYWVGEYGSVFSSRKGRWPNSSKPKFLRMSPSDSAGYPAVNIVNDRGSKRFLIHRLILTAFVGPCPEGMEACHFDGNKSNCTLANLRWATISENNREDKIRAGTLSRGEVHPRALMDEAGVRQMRADRETGMTLKSLGERYGVTLATAWDIVNHKSWSHVR